MHCYRLPSFHWCGYVPQGLVCYIFIFIQFFKKFYLFLAVLGPRCCMWAFSSCGEWGLLIVAVHGLLIAKASLCCRAQTVGVQASVVAACRLGSCGTCALERTGFSGCGVWAQELWLAGSVVVVHGLSCSAACGIFLDQGSNPCPLHWQADF